MARPIKFDQQGITGDIRTRVMNSLEEKLKTFRSSTGKFNFKFDCDLKYPKGSMPRVKVLYTPLAYLKQCALIQSMDYQEVAWNGFVDRVDDNTFIIKDIDVEPQKVNATQAEGFDDEKRMKWWMSLPDELANCMHMHAHSHVNMAVSPSVTDDQFREDMISQLRAGGFQIFMIWNKRYEHNVWVYDIDRNTVFETEDIDVGTTDNGFDMKEFLKTVKERVEVKTYANYGYGSGYKTGAYNFNKGYKQYSYAAAAEDDKPAKSKSLDEARKTVDPKVAEDEADDEALDSGEITYAEYCRRINERWSEY